MEGKDDEINTYNNPEEKHRKYNRITHPINEIKIWINKLLFADANSESSFVALINSSLASIDIGSIT